MANQHPLYSEHKLLAMEGGRLAVRVILERLDDGWFTVVHTEFHDLLSNPEMKVSDIGVSAQTLNLDNEQAKDWIFYPTIIAAVAESKAALKDYSSWMKAGNKG